jgi:RNA polymerase sigma factor (TIGR02999 family)
MGDITDLLNQARAGDVDARNRVFARVHQELTRLAAHKLSGESPITLLDPTSLVQEAYLRMVHQETMPGHNRRAFFAYAAQVMRSVMVDYVRSRSAEKRGGDVVRVTLTAANVASSMGDVDVEALDCALAQLKLIDERAHQVVEMRYFAGLSIEEVADTMSLSSATVKRDWEKARAILYKLMKD